MQLPKDRQIDFKRYGLYTFGMVCGYLMVFIVGPFFFSMGVILVITGALFGLAQLWSAGWIFMMVGIVIFILGFIIPKVCGTILGRMIVRDVTDIAKENEPAITAWAEAVNNQAQFQNNQGFSPYTFNGANMGAGMPGPNPTMPAGFPQPPPYPGRRQQETTAPPAYQHTHVHIPDQHGKAE